MAASYTPITTTGTYTAELDWLTAPPNAAFALELAASTTATFTVSYTLDEANPLVGAPNVGWTRIWIADPTYGTAQTTSVGGPVGGGYFPVRAVRVVVSALGGTASAMFVVLQGLSSR